MLQEVGWARQSQEQDARATSALFELLFLLGGHTQMTPPFDIAWWVALLTPFLVSLAIFLVRSAYRSTRNKLTLAYIVQEENSAALSSLRRVSIKCWNDGEDVIRGTDFAPKRPLKICHPNANFLNPAIKNSTGQENDVRFVSQKCPGEVQIHFEFLNPGDGFQWISDHDGDPGRISVEGTLMGGRANPRLHRPLSGVLLLGLCLALVFGGIDMAGTTVHIARTFGLASWWTLAYLPVPLFFTAGGLLTLSAFLSLRRERVPLVIKRWS